MSYRDRDRYDSPPRRYRDDSPPRGRYNDRGGGGGGRDDRRRAGSPRAPFGKRLPSPAPPPGLRYPRRRAPLDGHNNSDTLHRPPRETRGPEFSCRSDSHDEHINLAEDIYDALVKEDKPCIYLRCWMNNTGSLFWSVKTLTLVYNLLQGEYDVCCMPTAVERDEVVLKCFLQKPLDPEWTVEAFKLRVASDSLPARVATSVKVTFLKGRKCFLVACGWDPVKVAVLALWYAQRFLQEDWWEGVQLAFRPRYVELAGCKGIEMCVMVIMPESFAQVGTGGSTCSSLWVGNISEDCTEGMLNDEFSKHGPLDTVRLLGRDTDGSYFGYANYKTTEFASDALRAVDGLRLGGSRLHVKFAAMTSSGSKGGKGFGGGGGGKGKAIGLGPTAAAQAEIVGEAAVAAVTVTTARHVVGVVAASTALAPLASACGNPAAAAAAQPGFMAVAVEVDRPREWESWQVQLQPLSL
eukprot:CAMPEP_0174313700 /NCGR_PEP_ID=MMETSP0810-20121108/5163_1 /TAXON_ID=73025 ORGANISM="Eutreptiella gymnastica-like, Strain CCMP1594" /NCGR_SAMPLE_ID=MMETSP0810 /ASSEMBLY_ACC=CAM_ASM_000659 /LENGTH=465 /DNA_ID=CAMNT_0015422577 /DNA_START=13 /DNA_END=1411 /DNA_ORIENTATION=+